MKKIAVVSAAGIGDGLILLIASYNLQASGWKVTTFNDHLAGFGQWLPAGLFFAPQPPLDDLEELFLRNFDAVFLQHDNSEKAKKIASLPLPVYLFYGSFSPSKYGTFPREKYDYVCDPHKTMVANLVQAIGKIFGACSTENGLSPPSHLQFRKYPNRIAIHPTSTQEEKNWPREKFFHLYDRLQRKGWDPVFTTSPKEQEEWGGPCFPTLESLTSFLYESGGFIGNDSGLGHIVSYLGLPYLIIGKNETHMELWKPGWKPGKIITPPVWISNWKWTRDNWKFFVTVNSVLQGFKSCLTIK